MCAVTRAVLPESELIRFVAAPDGSVVADLKAKLPGRGVWIGGERELVAQAVKRNAFSTRPEGVRHARRRSSRSGRGAASGCSARPPRSCPQGRSRAHRICQGRSGNRARGACGGSDRRRRGRGQRAEDRAGASSPLWKFRADTGYSPLPVGGIGFGNRPAKCDTCCRASSPGWQKFLGSGFPPPALRWRGRWPDGKYDGPAAGYDE